MNHHAYDAVVFVQHENHVNVAFNKNMQALGVGLNPILIAVVPPDREIKTIVPLCYASSTQEALIHLNDQLSLNARTIGQRIVALADGPDDAIAAELSRADKRIRVAYLLKARTLRHDRNL